MPKTELLSHVGQTSSGRLSGVGEADLVAVLGASLDSAGVDVCATDIACDAVENPASCVTTNDCFRDGFRILEPRTWAHCRPAGFRLKLADGGTADLGMLIEKPDVR